MVWVYGRWCLESSLQRLAPRTQPSINISRHCPQKDGLKSQQSTRSTQRSQIWQTRRPHVCGSNCPNQAGAACYWFKMFGRGHTGGNSDATPVVQVPQSAVIDTGDRQVGSAICEGGTFGTARCGDRDGQGDGMIRNHSEGIASGRQCRHHVDLPDRC